MRLRAPLVPAGRGQPIPRPSLRLLELWPILVTVLFIVYLATSRHLPSDRDGLGPGDLRRPSRELVEPGTREPCSCPPAAAAAQLPATGLGGAPLHCRLGLPPGSGGSDGGAGSGEDSGGGASSSSRRSKHKLAVLIPYRDRETHLSTLLSRLHPYLQRQGADFDCFVIEQGDGYLFNRGALLNAGALLLEGSSYDYYVFQDVDTIPKEEGGIRYAYPRGATPLHLSPFGIHPKANYEDFFGGIVIFTREQLRAVNGFGTQFWGWGREDDNMRERLVRAGLWPPEHPDVPDNLGQQQQQGEAAAGGRKAKLTDRARYFQHQHHKQASELRGREVNGSMVYFEENPNRPYSGAKIMSSQPGLLQDTSTGLNTTQFRVTAVRPFAEAVKYTVELYCDISATPWCLPSAITQRPVVKRGHHVHAVASGIT